jgi:hypothetical protein
MAIQVTGSLKNGFASYTDPQIQLIPHLTYRSKIAMDAQIVIAVTKEYPTGSMNTGSYIDYNQVGTIPYYPETADLVAPPTTVDPYSDLIYSLETYVINSLTGSNPGTIFNRF